MSTDKGKPIQPKDFQKIWPSNLRTLVTWCTIGADVDNGKFAMLGARMGSFYTVVDPGNNDFNVSDLKGMADYFQNKVPLEDIDSELVPLVATFHPPFDAGLRNLTAGTQQLTYQLYAPALARFNRVIVFSELQAEVLQRLGVRRERLAVIPNGVDTRNWQPAEAQTPLHADISQRVLGRRVFLYMGRIATEKNVEALLRAWRLVRLEGCVLVIVGDGPLRSSLEATYSDPSLLWWGYEPLEAVRLALLQVAEVFLLPSLVEGLSLSLLEAMASGTACVATDAGADGEVLAGGAGIVISTQGVTTQLRTLLPVLRDQPVLTAELGRRARERALQRYTLSGAINALEELYDDLLDPSLNRPPSLHSR